MRKPGMLLAFFLLALVPALAQEKPAKPPLKLKVGDTAPDFTLKVFDGAKLKDISLHDFRGKKNVVLAVFVFAFTGG
jgi:AhpC/TSA family